MNMYRNPVVRRYKNPIDSLRTDLGAQTNSGARNKGGSSQMPEGPTPAASVGGPVEGSDRVPQGQVVEHRDIYDLVTFTAPHAARCTARHAVGSHAVPPTMEWAMPTGKKFARQSRAA
jgi:hypothetical protein